MCGQVAAYESEGCPVEGEPHHEAPFIANHPRNARRLLKLLPLRQATHMLPVQQHQQTHLQQLHLQEPMRRQI